MTFPNSWSRYYFPLLISPLFLSSRDRIEVCVLNYSLLPLSYREKNSSVSVTGNEISAWGSRGEYLYVSAWFRVGALFLTCRQGLSTSADQYSTNRMKQLNTRKSPQANEQQNLFAKRACYYFRHIHMPDNAITESTGQHTRFLRAVCVWIFSDLSHDGLT